MDSLFDTHAHLDDEQFADVRDEVIARAVAAGVRYMIAMGTTATSSQKCWEIAEGSPHVWAAAGIQPNYAHEAKLDGALDAGQIRALVAGLGGRMPRLGAVDGARAEDCPCEDPPATSAHELPSSQR